MAASSRMHASGEGNEAKRLEVGELVRLCEQLVHTYNAGRTTIDTHTDEFLAEHHVRDPDDARFLQQVMYGCVRYKKLLKIFISSLYFKHGGESQRSDASLYTVFGYLALLRLSELGFADFRALVKSQESHTMSVFLRFLFNEQNLKTWLRPEWLKHYEPVFVDDQLVAKALVFVPQVEPLVNALEGAIAESAAKREADAEAVRLLAEGKGGKGEHTVPEPFELSQPRFRTVPVPEEAVDVGFTAVPVPASTYLDSTKLRDRVELDKVKRQNREQQQAKYADPAAQPFKLKMLERPTNLEKVKQEVEAARQAACDFDRKNRPVVPPPKPKPGAGNVRLNSAAVLREDNLYRKKQEQEAAKLRAYEAELRDSSEFDEWRDRMRKVDDEAERARMERRRVEALVADEAARESKLRQANDNKAVAIAARATASQGTVRRLKETAARRQAQLAVVAEVHSQRERPALAVEEVRQAKLAAAAETRDEMERHAEVIAAERRAEEERRADLIKQIRALERVPKKRVVAFDPTYVPPVGVLEQMSLAELRERLATAEEERKAEEMKRRQKIVEAKRSKEEDLKGRIARLSAMRDLAANDTQRRAEAAKRAEAEAVAARAVRLAEAQAQVHAKLEAKRAARLQEEARLAAEVERIKMQAQFLGNDRDAVEKKTHLSQRDGAQRDALARQGALVDAAEKRQGLMEKEIAQRRANLQREREAHQRLIQRFEADAADASTVAAEQAAALDASRQMLKTRLGIGYGWTPEQTTAATAALGGNAMLNGSGVLGGGTKQMTTGAGQRRLGASTAAESTATRGL